MNKLVLIVEPNKIYLDKLVLEYKNKFKEENPEAYETTSWNTGVKDLRLLFGVPFIILNLEEEKDLKKFEELADNFLKYLPQQEKLEKKKKDYFEKNNQEYELTEKEKKDEEKRLKVLELFEKDWYERGVLIIANKQYNSIEKFIKYFNGEIVYTKDMKQKKKELLEQLKIEKDIKEFLSDYAGDNYEILAIFKQNIGDSEKITLNNIFTFLPTIPGKLPPWVVISSLFNLDSNGIKEQVERIRLVDSGILIATVTMLKNKMGLFYEYVILDENGYKDKEKANLMNLTNEYQFIDFKNLKRIKKRLPSSDTVYEICNLCYQLESNIKGGKSLNNLFVDYIENTLFEILLKLKE